MTWAQAKIFYANIAKLKRTSKAALQLIDKKDAKKVSGIKPVPSQTQRIPNGRRSRKHERSRSMSSLVSLRPESHAFRFMTTFVSNAKTESILGGIHTWFENSRQMNIYLAHTHLLPASCPSNIVFCSHQNQFFVRTLTEGIIIII